MEKIIKLQSMVVNTVSHLRQANRDLRRTEEDCVPRALSYDAKRCNETAFSKEKNLMK